MRPTPIAAGNFWANIHGQVDRHLGDAYSSFCRTQRRTAARRARPIETPAICTAIPNGNSFSFTLLDMAFHNKSGGVANGDACAPGITTTLRLDRQLRLVCGPTVTVALFAPDPTPLILTDNGAPLLQAYLPPLPQVNPDSDPPFTATGSELELGHACSVTAVPGPTGPGSCIVNTRRNVNRAASIGTRCGPAEGAISSVLGISPCSTTRVGHRPSIWPRSRTTTPGRPSSWSCMTRVTPMPAAPSSSAPPGSSSTYGSAEMFTRNNPGHGPSRRIVAGLPVHGSTTGELTTTTANGSNWRPPVACTEVGSSGVLVAGSITPSRGVQDTTTWLAYMIGNPIHLVDRPQANLSPRR